MPDGNMDTMQIGMRRESINNVGRMRGGKLMPVAMHAFEAGEGGMIRSNVSFELDPVAGRIITPVTAEVFAVYVPIQALDYLKNFSGSGMTQAGNTEILRQKLMSGTALFGVQTAENDISKRLGIVPCKVGGVVNISECIHLAHNAAVNFLRLMRYPYATQVASSNLAMTNALLSSTAMARFGGVLDPDDHINGQINLGLSGKAYVDGIGLQATSSNNPISNDTGIATAGPGTSNSSMRVSYPFSFPGDVTTIRTRVTTGTTTQTRPDVFVDLDKISAGGATLTDFYNAERMDKLTRQFDAMIQANGNIGLEQVTRWCYGLSVDSGKECFLLHESSIYLGMAMQRATDASGIETEVSVSRLNGRIGFTVPVPRTELGGFVVTFASVKPDEKLDQQPHPYLSGPWVQSNRVADSFAIDPVPVTGRELSADIAQAAETTVMFYTGKNALKRTFVQYGFNRALDPSTVENKTAIWQYNVPLSVTPDNIVYPDDISHYPFMDQLAEVALVQCASDCVVRTPVFFGPSPVETVDAIENDDLFPGDGLGATGAEAPGQGAVKGGVA